MRCCSFWRWNVPRATTARFKSRRTREDTQHTRLQEATSAQANDVKSEPPSVCLHYSTVHAQTAHVPGCEGQDNRHAPAAAPNNVIEPSCLPPSLKPHALFLCLPMLVMLFFFGVTSFPLRAFACPWFSSLLRISCFLLALIVIFYALCLSLPCLVYVCCSFFPPKST